MNVTKRLKSSEEVENEKPAVQRHPSLSIGDNQSKQKLVVNLTSNVASNDTSDDQVVKRQSHSHRLKDKENIGDGKFFLLILTH